MLDAGLRYRVVLCPLSLMTWMPEHALCLTNLHLLAVPSCILVDHYPGYYVAFLTDLSRIVSYPPLPTRKVTWACLSRSHPMIGSSLLSQLHAQCRVEVCRSVVWSVVDDLDEHELRLTYVPLLTVPSSILVDRSLPGVPCGLPHRTLPALYPSLHYPPARSHGHASPGPILR